ncbi:MAG: TIGR00159 family protein [Lachnospiraceae bacterium]|nr:TIGR00159 family protein [Lachnospiraceae bacterium]
MGTIKDFFDKYLIRLSLPQVTLIDILEVLIIAFAIYHIVMWVKNTRAWMLVKGVVFLLVFFVVAMFLRMDVILWIFRNAISVGIIAVIIVFQPELRSALEQLGRRNVFVSIFSSESEDDRISERVMGEIVNACAKMSREKTGALIVIENEIQLKEHEKNGIYLNADISMQLITNIFEHNTPLHDGATIIRDNKILAATCYLPLSDNMELSKELGTRHRAAVGISEISDSLTIVVSEESGIISVARFGELKRNVSPDELKKLLISFAGTDNAKSKKNIWRRKGGKTENDEANTK